MSKIQIQRKEKEACAIAAKIDDEGTLGSKYSKQIKELQSRLEELDDELASERKFMINFLVFFDKCLINFL